MFNWQTDTESLTWFMCQVDTDIYQDRWQVRAVNLEAAPTHTSADRLHWHIAARGPAKEDSQMPCSFDRLNYYCMSK